MGNDKVTIGCKDTAITLAVLDIALSFTDKDSLSATLKEAEIAIDLESVLPRLRRVLNHVKDRCEDEQKILKGIKFK
jgi:hypothetical protein